MIGGLDVYIVEPFNNDLGYWDVRGKEIVSNCKHLGGTWWPSHWTKGTKGEYVVCIVLNNNNNKNVGSSSHACCVDLLSPIAKIIWLPKFWCMCLRKKLIKMWALEDHVSGFWFMSDNYFSFFMKVSFFFIKSSLEIYAVCLIN